MGESYTIQLGGFTLVPDKLVKEFGFFTAGVYGKIWRYEQMSDEVCRASLERLAEELGASDDTVHRHIRKLEQAGYILDLTPKLRNRPHLYKTTGKLSLSLTLAEAEGKQEVPQNAVVLPQNKVVRYRKMRDESDYLKRQKKRESPLAYQESWGDLVSE